MVRLEFVKGQGGVANIINGNLKDTDRNALLNIEDIDKVVVSFYTAIAINESLIAIEISGYIIVFDALSSLEPYLAQIDMIDGEVFNPGVNGIKTPDWDSGSRDKTVGIQSHSYDDTDIERDLINS